MIAYEIKDRLIHISNAIEVVQGREPNLAVYISNNTWQDMIRELCDVLSHDSIETLTQGGNSILGYPIYKVADKEHGWKIFDLHDAKAIEE